MHFTMPLNIQASSSGAVTSCSSCSCNGLTVINNHTKRIVNAIAKDKHYELLLVEIHWEFQNIGANLQAAVLLLCQQAIAPMVLTSVSPMKVSSSGGAELTFVGNGLINATHVNFYFNGNPPVIMSAIPTSDTTFTTNMPKLHVETSATVYITVTNSMNTKTSNAIPITVTNETV